MLYNITIYIYANVLVARSLYRSFVYDLHEFVFAHFYENDHEDVRKKTKHTSLIIFC